MGELTDRRNVSSLGSNVVLNAHLIEVDYGSDCFPQALDQKDLLWTRISISQIP